MIDLVTLALVGLVIGGAGLGIWMLMDDPPQAPEESVEHRIQRLKDLALAQAQLADEMGLKPIQVPLIHVYERADLIAMERSLRGN